MTRPDTLANVPCAQGEHADWPSEDVALPGVHGEHTALPNVDANVPTLHCKQIV